MNPVPPSRGLFAADRLSPSAAQRVANLANLLSALAFVLGVAGLAGWRFDVPVLRHLVADLPPLRPAGAISLTLLGGALRFAARRPGLGQTLALATMVLALGALVPGMAGIDEWARGLVVHPHLLADTAAEMMERAGPTPPPAAMGFLCLATAYVIARWPALVGVAQTLAVVAMFMALVPLLGHLYGIHSFSSPLLPAAPAFQAVVGVVMLAGGIMLLHPQRGIVGLLSGDTSASRAARRLLLPALSLPILLGGVFVWARQTGSLDLDAAVPTFVSALAATLGGSVLWVAREGARVEILQRRSDQALRAMANSSPLMTWMADGEGRCTHLNTAIAEFLGHSFDEMADDAWREVTHPEDLAVVNAEIRAAVRGRRTFSAEFRVRAADGSLRWVLSTGMPRFSARGRLMGYVGSWADVTVRRDAEEALQRFAADLEEKVAERTAMLLASKEELADALTATRRLAAVVESSADAILSVTPDGRISTWNRGAEQMYGYTAAEAVGQPLARLDPSPGPNGTAAMLDALLHGESTIRLDTKGKRKDGTVLDITATMAPVHDDAGMIVAGAVVHHDVGHLKEVERRIQALNDELEQRVRDRTAALLAASRDLENYASSVAHDLRTPLRAIAGFARVLEEDYGETVGDEGRRVIGVVRKNAQDMGDFIDALLKFSAVERQPPVKSQVQVAALVRECVDAVGGDLGERAVAFHVGDLPPCQADPTLLRQVFLNLLANAVKFTRPRDQAHIEVGSREVEGGLTAYFVRDNGVGFDMSNTRRLFGIFQRLHAPGQFEGTGLGLANVARIVAAHGGRVWAEAEPGKGATFYFTVEQREGNA